MIDVKDKGTDLAHRGFRAVIRGPEVRRGFALNGAGIVVGIQSDFSGAPE
jgi:hypothetical protein